MDFRKAFFMNKTSILRYIAALFAFFAVGCAGALLLWRLDLRAEAIAPLQDGQTAAFSGFSLTLPPEAEVLRDDAETDAQGGALDHAVIVLEGGLIRFAAYENETHERIEDIDAQALITQYTRAGASDARLRTLGGRRFIEYAVTLDGTRYTLYETWDERSQLIFETNLDTRDVLPILASIAF